jgi:uncharacterized phage protein (TIGR01671 family)
MDKRTSIRSGIGENVEDRYFKAKRLDNGEWVQGFYLYDYGRNIHYIFANEIVCPNCINDCRKEFSLQDYEVDPSTICRCTGLKDKNGKLIWENDIVKINNSKVNTVIAFRDFEIICTIPNEKYYKHRLEYDTEYEVIGNKFDNPELLESEG